MNSTEKMIPVYENGQNKNDVPMVSVRLPETKADYRFFCKGLYKVLAFVVDLLNQAVKDLSYVADSVFVALVKSIWIVHHAALKLEGIDSISSSVIDNIICQCRRKIKDCICKSCYADSQQRRNFGLQEHNIINGIIFRNILIPVKFFRILPIFSKYLRVESFGDVMNVIQARNYIRIIKAFPDRRSAIWSKNIGIWEKAFKIEGKPANCTYIHSSGTVNQVDEFATEYEFVDHIFTVYDKAYAKKHNIIINCGGRKCMECIIKRKNCYYRVNKNNNTLYINELKK